MDKVLKEDAGHILHGARHMIKHMRTWVKFLKRPADSTLEETGTRALWLQLNLAPGWGERDPENSKKWGNPGKTGGEG